MTKLLACLFAITACSSSAGPGGPGSNQHGPDAGQTGPKLHLGDSCRCSGKSGTFWFCSGSEAPCEADLNCVGGGSSGNCFGAMCCSGTSECDITHQGDNNAKCPSGQVCSVFDGGIGFCGTLP